MLTLVDNCLTVNFCKANNDDIRKLLTLLIIVQLLFPKKETTSMLFVSHSSFITEQQPMLTLVDNSLTVI